MDETLKKITHLLSKRRAELQEHFKTSDTWENTTSDLLDRVERLKTRLESSALLRDGEKKD